MAENSVRKQRGPGKPFQKGQSGNPAGKPKGARHAVSTMVDALIEGEAEALTQKALELANAGDTRMLLACLDRLAPARKSRPIKLDLPKVDTAADLPAAMGAVTDAMAGGEIDPDEAAAVTCVLEARRRAIETADLATRLEALEKHLANRKP